MLRGLVAKFYPLRGEGLLRPAARRPSCAWTLSSATAKHHQIHLRRTLTFVPRQRAAGSQILDSVHRVPEWFHRLTFLRAPKRAFTTSTRRSGASSGSRSGKGADAAQASESLSGRLKKLSREYGWVAIGVYLGLSVLDFPFCFLLVRAVGTEKIGEIEHLVVEKIKALVPNSIRDRWNEYRKEASGTVGEEAERVGWGVEEASERHKAEASLGTQLALAYAVHKSFIFVRIPLTAAVTPQVVKVLRRWGYQIGKKAAKPKTRK